MSELAIKRMTVAEFLRWENGTDTRYELLAGLPVAMAPPRFDLGPHVSVRARRGSPDRTGTTPAISPILP